MDQYITCTHCGEMLMLGSYFCSRCGASMLEEEDMSASLAAEERFDHRMPFIWTKRNVMIVIAVLSIVALLIGVMNQK
ncbi:MAG: hypothetical protein FWE76_03880 [Symbiobacteriaceae bacterium]|nr:hypothetical protein [Symbiobacteriaceae bacterium]